MQTNRILHRHKPQRLHTTTMTTTRRRRRKIIQLRIRRPFRFRQQRTFRPTKHYITRIRTRTLIQPLLRGFVIQEFQHIPTPNFPIPQTVRHVRTMQQILTPNSRHTLFRSFQRTTRQSKLETIRKIQINTHRRRRKRRRNPTPHTTTRNIFTTSFVKIRLTTKNTAN